MSPIRPTRQGVAVVVAGVGAAIVGRVFGIIELYVIAAAFFAAAAVGVLYVSVRHPSLRATRWIHPSLLVVGDTGRVDIRLLQTGRARTAPFVLEEPVVRVGADDHIARLPVMPLRPGTSSTSGYRVPTGTRGVIVVGPLSAVFGDALGLVRSSSVLADADEIVVAPRIHLLDMPQLGRGVLGRALLESSRRLGPGDFHGLREYATGDEPRSIHWRASARTDTLMVKEHTVEGLHQCTVVFDPSPGAHGSAEGFERGVTAAASLVHSAVRCGLATRFVTSGGIDLRGPDVAVNTLRVLARIQPTDAGIDTLGTDIVDGLAVMVIVTGTRTAAVWRASQALSDPTITRVLVSTAETVGSRLSVAARSDDEFVAGWQTMVGRA